MSSLEAKTTNRKPELISNGANFQINLGAAMLERRGLVHLSIIVLTESNEAKDRLARDREK